MPSFSLGNILTVFYKRVNVLCNSLRLVNIYLCPLLGNLHTNNCKNEFNGTCIHLTVNLLIWVKMFTFLFVGKRTRLRKEKKNATEHFTRKMFCACDNYKYFEAESEERHQSVAGIKCLKERCQITEICVFSMYSYVNRLNFYILVYYTVGSLTFFEQYRYATVMENDWWWIGLIYL